MVFIKKCDNTEFSQIWCKGKLISTIQSDLSVVGIPKSSILLD